MVNKPLIRPYFWGGSFGGGVARIPIMESLMYLFGGIFGFFS